MMKKYHTPIFIRIIIVVVISISIGILCTKEYYCASILLAIALAFPIIQMFKFLTRTTVDTNRLIDAIQLSEFNISFDASLAKGLHPDVANRMKRATEILGERMRGLKEDQFFYDMLLSRVDTPILLIDSRKNISWINKAATDIFGTSNPKSLNDLDSDINELSSFFNELKPREVKTVVVNKNDKELKFASTAVYLTMKGEELKLVSLKNIQHPLEENESLAWERLIKILTHEIMNSLTPIISLAETFAETDLKHNTEMMGKAMQTIYRRSKGLVEFVTKYQQLTQITQPSKASFSAYEMMGSLHSLLNAHNVSFTFRVIDPDLQIVADRGQLEQVIINLIKNAWEATSQDRDAKVDVVIKFDEYQDTVITVSDNGCGISNDTYENIFMPFYTTKQSGSGLGLSICRQMINNHGGHIFVSSQENKGSQFTIKL